MKLLYRPPFVHKKGDEDFVSVHKKTCRIFIFPTGITKKYFRSGYFRVIPLATSQMVGQSAAPPDALYMELVTSCPAVFTPTTIPTLPALSS